MSRARPVGLAPGPIPIAETFALWRALPLGEPLEFLQLVQAMDAAYLEHHAEQQANKKK